MPEIKEPLLQESKLDLENDIYYHRELLINSIENRRIDLLTITSFHGLTEEREERLTNLFPESQTPRCHKFKNKKVNVAAGSLLMTIDCFFVLDYFYIITCSSR